MSGISGSFSPTSLTSLTAVSPIDGRYQQQTKILSNYFSEFALIRYRIRVELDYFKLLIRVIPQLKNVPVPAIDKIQALIHTNAHTQSENSFQQIKRIKEIESITGHDVKAVEYYLKEQFALNPDLIEHLEWIHFGLTSQDINQTALGLQLDEFHRSHFLVCLETVGQRLAKLAIKWQNIPMLARTHGQPASPTNLGKEILVFERRLDRVLESLRNHIFRYKFGGAVGNFNTHHVAFPQIDWPSVVDKLYPQLERTTVTTQIEPYDNLAEYCHSIIRVNNILIDLNRDMWQYISMGYFCLAVPDGQIGSSTMPHKINPIDFENSEGNLGLANALLDHLANKLPISRLQRDLTDSTVVRNIGVALGHCFLAYQNLIKGLSKLSINEIRLAQDLDQHWEVLAEAVQTILRRENYPRPYELLKELTQNSAVDSLNQAKLHEFIESLSIDPKVKEELKALSPHNYIGLSFSKFTLE